MCLSKPNIPEPPQAPVIADQEKKIELNPGKKASTIKAAGRVGTARLQIPLGGKSKASGLKIPG